MSAAEVLHQLEAAGVRVVMPEPERLRVIGGDDACAKIKALVLDHRQEIVDRLRAVPIIPPHITTTLTDVGYSPPEWTRHHAAHMAASVQGRRAEHLHPVDPGPLTQAAPDRRTVRGHPHPHFHPRGLQTWTPQK